MQTSPQLQHLESIYERLAQSRQMYQAAQTEQAQILLQLSIMDTLLLVADLMSRFESKLLVLEQKVGKKGVPSVERAG